MVWQEFLIKSSSLLKFETMFSNKSGKHFEAFWCPIGGWGTLFGASRVARGTTLDPMDQEPPKSAKNCFGFSFEVPFMANHLAAAH